MLRKPAQQKDSDIVEEYLVVDHVHMLISISPKYATVQAIGFIKGRSAI